MTTIAWKTTKPRRNPLGSPWLAAPTWGCHGEHRQHRREGAKAIERPSLRKAGGVPGVPHPRPPDRDEERGKQCHPRDRRIAVQRVRNRADSHDKTEIEEEL
jgi:hypothetical protein